MTAHTTSKYFAIDFWEGQLPAAELAKTVYYSTNFYTERALALLRNFSADSQTAATAAAAAAAVAGEGGGASTIYSSERAAATAAAAAARIWIHLCYQAVHGPFTDVPEWEALDPPYLRGGSKVYGDMLAVMDSGIANITSELQRSGLYKDTLIISVSDKCAFPLHLLRQLDSFLAWVIVHSFAPHNLPNDMTHTLLCIMMRSGGPSSTTGPNNWPLRGSKESPWEGGTRVAAFISGGFLPPAVRGTVSHSFIHVAE